MADATSISIKLKPRLVRASPFETLNTLASDPPPVDPAAG